MHEETKEEKAKKLAAARKKLKEYQRRGAELNTRPLNNNDTTTIIATPTLNSTLNTVSSMSQSPISEKSDPESIYNGHNVERIADDNAAIQMEHISLQSSNDQSLEAHENASPKQMLSPALPEILKAHNSQAGLNQVNDDSSVEHELANSSKNNTNIIDIVIKEKSKAIEDLQKYRMACTEKDAQLEELHKSLLNKTHSLDEMQKLRNTHEQHMQELRNRNEELETNLVQLRTIKVDQARYLDELKSELSKVSGNLSEMQKRYNEKCNELEMAQIRIQQLSDEGNSTKDIQIENFNQTQLMHEQQIRDLQAMVQHLTQEKEQANLQYQTYVQHLNAEVTKLNEKNAEMSEECTRLQERERQLVHHIGGLERDIQKNISRREEIKKQDPPVNSSELSNEIEKLKEIISDFDSERHEFQLKIKSQEDRLEKLNSDLEQKQGELEELQARLEEMNAVQPDTTKLLATMESDKVAASRALSQNMELKKQLDELELRFVQLTNDKADLMNKLDAEEFANREMRSSYTTIELKMHESEERFKFKDEEMIRLSHENVELLQQVSELKNQLDAVQKHQRISSSEDIYHGSRENLNNKCGHEHNEAQDHNYKNDNGHKDHKHHHTNDDLAQVNNNAILNEQMHESDECQEAQEDNVLLNSNKHMEKSPNPIKLDATTPQPHIATEEAVEKLQQRFMQLITQVSELTDERERLEHLVMQLQSETETIGEYITLYQTQRRILKQREYEKAAQMKLLQSEREQLHQKITMLNNLVSSLGVELPTLGNNTMQESNSSTHIPESSESASMATSALSVANLNSNESKEILNKIQDIITEIKENTRDLPTVTHTVDHLNCCLGKFETV